jgi:TrmH RNA methyltransferase
MEYVKIHPVRSLAEFIRELRSFYTVIGAAVRGGDPLIPNSRPQPPGSKPPALVLGNEEQGLAPDVAAACERLVHIPGAGAIESLNVSTAAAVLCWELFGRGRRVSIGPSRHT